MNIFVIPSWYPGRDGDVSGIFFKEQAVALGEMYPETKIAISLWGQSEYFLYLKRLQDSVSALMAFAASRPSSKRNLRDNVAEYETPALSWTMRLFRGNGNALLKANRHNLRRAAGDIGHFDVIHAHVSYPAGWIAMKLSRETGIPYLITEHMGPFPLRPYMRDGRLREEIAEALGNASGTIAVSTWLSGQIREYCPAKPDVIPNMVDEDFFFPSETDRYRDPVFFTLGSMEPGKGISDLLHAIALVAGKGRRAHFRIGGTGRYEKTYRRLAEKLEIEESVAWLGRLDRKRVRQEMSCCDVFILPSHLESFGVVYAEAIACGKPVIATRCGGPEGIVNDTNGVLVDVGSIEQIAEAIILMSTNYKQYDCGAIRQDFLERFSKKVVTKQIMEVYRKCV